MDSLRIFWAPALLAALLLNANHALAQTDYQWQDATSGGLWNTPGNWNPAGPASGSANTADFSALVLPASNTVHLNVSETVGGLIFGDLGNTYNWTLDNNGSGSNVLTLAGSATVTVNNDTATLSAVVGGSAGLTVYGGSLLSTNGQVFNLNIPMNIASAGTLVLNPAAVETYSGTTTVNGGALSLNFANLSTPTNLIGSGSALTLGGGTLAVSNQAGAVATSQSFAGLALNAGSSAISVSSAGNTNAASTLALGAITRNAGGTVNFALPATGAITTTTANTATTILGGWATVGGATWATSASNGSSPGAIGGVPASAYTMNAFAAGSDTMLTGFFAIPSDTTSINSLTFNAPGSYVQAKDLNGDTLTIASGGILVTPATSTGGATTGSSLTINTTNGTNELVINQYDNNGTFTTDSTVNTAILTKNGPGILFFANAPIPATVNLNQGVLSEWNPGLPATLNFTGNATYQTFNTMASSIIAQGTTINISPGVTGTIDNNLPTTGQFASAIKSSIAGAGAFAYTSSTGQTTGAGFLVGFNGSTASTYTGNTTIYGGQLRLDFGFGSAQVITAANQNRLSPTGTLYLGGVLSVVPTTSGAAVTTVQTFGSNLVLIADSASALAEGTTSTAHAGTTLNLTSPTGSLTRNSGATLAVSQVDTFSMFHVGSGTVVSSSALLGGWAVYGTASMAQFSALSYAATDWATLDASHNFVGWSSVGGNSYNNNAWTGQTNITNHSNSFSGTTNSLRFDPADSGSYGITLAAGSAITTGGILLPTSASQVVATISGGSLTSGNGQDLIVNEYNATSGSSLTISSQITGSIGLTLSGNTQAAAGSGGVLVLNNPSNNNNYTGATAINAATTLLIAMAAGQQLPTNTAVVMSQQASLNLNANNQSIGSLASISYGTSVFTPGVATLTVGNDNTSTTYNGSLTGGLMLVKVGTGTLTLGDDGGTFGNGSINFNQQNATYLYALSTYTGGTIINGGAISIVADNCLGSTSGSVTINGTALAPSTLQTTGTFTSARSFNLGPISGSGQGTIDVTGAYTLTLTGAVGDNGGSGGLVKVDTGTLVLTNSGNTYSGGTTVTGGILNFNADSTLGATTANPNITFNGSTASGGGTLQFATSYSGTSLSGSRNILVTSGNAGTVDTNGNNITWGGTLNVAASGSFGKAGAGSFEIDSAPSLGSNSALAVSGGTLRLNYSGSPTIGSGITATVSGAATLELAGGTSQLSQSVNIVNNSSAASGLLDSSSTNQNVGAVTGTGNTVVNSGGTLTAYQIRQNSLTISGTGKVTLLPSGSGSTTNPGNPNNINFSSNVTTLNIAGATNAWTGTLDIGNNGLVVAYGSDTDPYATIDNQIKSGYNGGVWGGTGITSSLAAAAIHATNPLNIGLVDFTPGLHGDATFIVFSGQTITTNAILVRLTYMDDLVLAGDMSQNNATSDALLFAANFGTGTTWSVGDLTHDGVIDSNDALLFAANYGVGLPSLDGTTGNAGTFGGGTAAVPEPASLVLAVLGGILGGAVLRRHPQGGLAAVPVKVQSIRQPTVCIPRDLPLR